MTETSPAGTFTPAQKDGMRKVGSCGMPMPSIIIKFLTLITRSSMSRVANAEKSASRAQM
jgi:long-chain acyl-CoA synthetase